MPSYGVFESLSASHDEAAIVKEAHLRQVAAAVFAAREAFSAYLNGASDAEDFASRGNLVKDDLIQVVAEHVEPDDDVMTTVAQTLYADFQHQAVSWGEDPKSSYGHGFSAGQEWGYGSENQKAAPDDADPEKAASSAFDSANGEYGDDRDGFTEGFYDGSQVSPDHGRGAARKTAVADEYGRDFEEGRPKTYYPKGKGQESGWKDPETGGEIDPYSNGGQDGKYDAQEGRPYHPYIDHPEYEQGYDEAYQKHRSSRNPRTAGYGGAQDDGSEWAFAYAHQMADSGTQPSTQAITQEAQNYLEGYSADFMAGVQSMLTSGQIVISRRRHPFARNAGEHAPDLMPNGYNDYHHEGDPVSVNGKPATYLGLGQATTPQNAGTIHVDFGDGYPVEVPGDALDRGASRRTASDAVCTTCGSHMVGPDKDGRYDPLPGQVSYHEHDHTPVELDYDKPWPNTAPGPPKRSSRTAGELEHRPFGNDRKDPRPHKFAPSSMPGTCAKCGEHKDHSAHDGHEKSTEQWPVLHHASGYGDDGYSYEDEESSPQLDPGLAQQCLQLVEQKFSSYIEGGYGPKLIPDYETFSGNSCWAIVWEDGSPYEWAYLATGGGVDEEMAGLMDQEGAGPPDAHEPISWPAGVYAEPIMSMILGLYPSA